MKFFNLPPWVVWVLVGLAVVALCIFWQWRAAVRLLDRTHDELVQARAARDEAVARVKREQELAAEQRRIHDELVARLKQIDADRAAARERARAEEEAARREVAEKDSAVDLFNEWKKNR